METEWDWVRGDVGAEIGLDELQRGGRGRIRSLQEGHRAAERLCALGFLPGREVRLLGVAPLGDPLAVELGGRSFGIRRSEARCLRLEPVLSPAAAGGRADVPG